MFSASTFYSTPYYLLNESPLYTIPVPQHPTVPDAPMSLNYTFEIEDSSSKYIITAIVGWQRPLSYATITEYSITAGHSLHDQHISQKLTRVSDHSRFTRYDAMMAVVGYGQWYLDQYVLIIFVIIEGVVNTVTYLFFFFLLLLSIEIDFWNNIWSNIHVS